MTTPCDNIIQMLRDTAKAGILPTHIVEMPLSAQTTVADLGIDSLGKMGLLSALMEATDKYLDDGAIQDSHTLGEIAELVA